MNDVYIIIMFYIFILIHPGACFQLKDPQFALAVETCLRSLLYSFCCTDYHDEKVLEEIFQKTNKDGPRPAIIVSKFHVSLECSPSQLCKHITDERSVCDQSVGCVLSTLLSDHINRIVC